MLLAPSGVTLAGAPGEARAAEAAVQADPELAERVRRQWDDVRAALRRGDYAAAQRSLDLIRGLAPDDPDLPLYQLLLRARDESPSPFARMTPDDLASLKRRLDEEERGRRRNAAQLKALDRQAAKERAKWDQESKRLQRARPPGPPTTQAGGEAEQDAKRKQRARQITPAPSPAGVLAEAEVPARAVTAAPAGVSPSEETPERPAPGAALGAVRPAVPSGPATPGSVQLAPVTVETAARARPTAGAVQINANQISVSPDRKIAVAEGNVEVIFENAVLTCDHVTLFTDTKDVYAEGRVRLEEGTQVSRGELVHYNLETKKGRFLQGTVSTPPWHQHGRSVEHIAEGVYRVTPGYVTSCELEPPHFRFAGRRATVFADDKLVRVQNAALFVEQIPFLYLPWISVADRKSPFFLIPGKRKPWGEFALMGYRYELPGILGLSQKGAARLDWRRSFGWGMGLDHEIASEAFGKGLLKLYYNAVGDRTTVDTARPKGADGQRYRLLWRHRWQPMPDTTVITDLQKYSDVNFRKDFLFREEFTEDDASESFVSVVKNTPEFTVTGLVKRRLNRFQSVTEALPELTVSARPQQIGQTPLFSESQIDFANFNAKTAHSETDTDAVRVDWFQQLSYALNWFRPIALTPKVGIRQTYYTKDKQGGIERPQGKRDVISGQASAGADASLKLFRIFPVTTKMLGLDINWLRHVLTPTVAYSYVHRPTVPNDLLNFAVAASPTNQLAFSLENKLQTKRRMGDGKMRAVDVVRFITSVPYTFRGTQNKQGGRLGDVSFDLECYPWSWLRLESVWSVPSHFLPGSRDARIPSWSLDLVAVGGQEAPQAQYASDIQAPTPRPFQAGAVGGLQMLPQGQWYLGLGHRYSQNDKTEEVIQFDWRLTEKWQIGTFHRFTVKEVVNRAKRFHNLREYQYTLRRDLHDWVAELVYRVDREFGEELFFTLTLKAFPDLPIETETSYHQPKLGSQSSPFSPIRTSIRTP
ncbi:MAG: hypothetical protein A3B78_03040 [Omnitrophica WOR_2 bacterium RIFCSPHIGHO2_02_FULL_67_20]|nr:MAG: hypothetical protein A3B78_03040 [Omnitrophica WOR_2 bacterium RIFCSPHIGHO2_02_FULL_67_20]